MAGGAVKEPFCTINRKLLPLKLTLFFFAASAFTFLPYLTIHMKDIGISDIDIALIYTVLPFTVFIAPPLVGFLADRLGNYTRVLLANIVVCGIFHSSLLLVPETISKPTYPATSAVFTSNRLELQWSACSETNNLSCSLATSPKRLSLQLSNCSLTCPGSSLDQNIGVEANLCSLLPGVSCKPNPVRQIVTFQGLIAKEGPAANKSCGSASIELLTRGDPCQASDNQLKQVTLGEGCRAECSATTNLVQQCGWFDNGNRVLTNTVYFILRTIATMALACCFIMLDAQTIQMCKMEEAAGKKGSYGQQIVYKTLAQALISPLVGLVMDKVTTMTGYANYTAPFMIGNALLACTLVCICLLDGDIGLPKEANTMRGVKIIFTNVSIIIFLIMMFVCGTLYGFVETFLFVYLKADLNAPIYLLGLTITTGALVSIPFLYYSDWIIEKFGMVNMIILALLMYGVRYVGYSYITCAWYAFPFEALEVFTIFLLRVGSASYVKVNAPPGTLATLNGLSGGMHFGFGKGMGGLVGGVLKDQLGSTALAFRTFGIAAFVFGVIYAIFYWAYGRGVDQRAQEKRERDAASRLEPLMPKPTNGTS